jgi:hypothetical protein
MTCASAAIAAPLHSSSVALRPSLASGWVEVTYKDAQVAVPSSFSVVYPNEQYCGVFASTGTIFLGAVAVSESCLENQSPGAQVTLVYMRSQYFSADSLQGYKSIRQDGLRLYLVTVNGAPGYYSPALGAEVAANGPDALGVLSTFAPSPRRLVLASGPAPQVPSSWRTVSFDGVFFSVPSDWTVKRTNYAMGIGQICSVPGVALGGTGDSVVLSTDKKFYAVACPLIGQWPQVPADGVQVDGGPEAPSVTASSHCLSLKALHACLAGGTSYLYSILVLKVVVPGRSKPVYVSIGLAGSGMVARTILYSLRASPASGHPLQIAGTIAGTLVRVGGPAPGAVALPGQVTAKSSTGRKFTVTVGKSGKFVLSLSPGEYKLTGHSPLVSQETCMATKPVRVKTGQRVSGVEVICSIS